jgi:thiamine pyrophosphate-dependent acetolactate synthase large subunit-like protein
MTTKEVLEIIKERVPPDTAFIASLGRTSEEAFNLFPDQTLFLDSMGDVSSTACGVAIGLSPNHPVVALDTDGSHLMGVTLLPTLASLVARLPNFLLVVLDNGIYESGGGLPSRAVVLDWHLLGRAFGFEVRIANTRAECESALSDVFTRFVYLVIKIENVEPSPAAKKNVDGVEAKYRFVRHLERVLGRTLLVPAVKS